MPIRRSHRPARAQSVATCTRKGGRREQSCKGRTSRAVNRAILFISAATGSLIQFFACGPNQPLPPPAPGRRQYTSAPRLPPHVTHGPPYLPFELSTTGVLQQAGRHTRHLAKSPD